MFHFAFNLGHACSRDGVEIPPTSVVRHSDPDDYYQTSSGRASFGVMSLPVADMVFERAALAEIDLTPPKDLLMVTPPPTEMERLRRL